MLQLQRIMLDYDTFQNTKINTRFEFPNVLDLTEFSLNHIMRKEGKLTDTLINEFREKENGQRQNEEQDE